MFTGVMLKPFIASETVAPPVTIIVHDLKGAEVEEVCLGVNFRLLACRTV